jgi:glycosyltransferase involved in cell wall biosynthesis
MKILITEPCYENYGGYFRAFGIAKALSLKGVKVDLLVSTRKKFSLKIDKRIINENLVQYDLPRIEVNYFITGRLLRAFLSLYFVVFRKYDLIHTFALVQFESSIPFVAAKLLGKKVVVDWDDYWSGSDELVSIHKRFGIIMKYLRFCEYILQKYADYATATSDFLMEKLKKLGVKSRLKIVNGVNKEQFTPVGRREARDKLCIGEEERVLLTFGHTFYKERTGYLFRTFEEMFRMDGTIKLYCNRDPQKMIGEQASGEKFDERIFDNIVNIGYFPDEKLALYVGAADCVLFVMGETECEQACFPTRIGTFLNGEKVIATNRTDTEACRTLEQYNCALVGETPKELAQKIVDFLGDENQKGELESNVQRAKEDLSWENLTNGLLNFYDQILNSHL